MFVHKRYAMLATCQLNQWAMSFRRNRDNIIKSIKIAKELGATYRLGPELEIPGYSCEDHFFELDTVRHSWQSLADILTDRTLTQGILCDIGMPVHFNSTLYNCRVICLNGKILLIRPKMFLAEGNNYREARWFTAWRQKDLVSYKLDSTLSQITGQSHVPFGNAVLECNDTTIACEICEELWVTQNPHVEYGLDGVEIIGNGSASHHELRKLNSRLQLIRNATSRNGGVYVYSNLKGCDGGRIYFDGASSISMNGVVYQSLPQFSINDVEVRLGVVDLDFVRSKRGNNNSRGVQSSMQTRFPRIKTDIDICRYVTKDAQKESLLSGQAAYESLNAGVGFKNNDAASNPLDNFGIKLHTPVEEIANAPALWMWDYLRRTPGARGFFLPLSGGADSAAVAAIVASMARLVFESSKTNPDCLSDIRRIVGDPTFKPQRYQDIVNQIFVTCYLGTKNSSADTLSRARRLAEGIGARHYNVTIDEAYDSIVRIF
jgi:NAD+ synthase (glutamine-hydrolysing)